MSDDRAFGYVCFLVILVFLVLAAFPTGVFVREEVAVKALENHGFSDVEVVDRAVWFVSLRGGSERDAVRFTCYAVNPAGKRVKIYVFSGWLFKGATIRTLD